MNLFGGGGGGGGGEYLRTVVLKFCFSTMERCVDGNPSLDSRS